MNANNSSSKIKKSVELVSLGIYILILLSMTNNVTFMYYTKIPFWCVFGLLIILLTFGGKIEVIKWKNIVVLLGFDAFSVLITKGGGGSWLIQAYIILFFIVYSNINIGVKGFIAIRVVFISLWGIWCVRSIDYFDKAAHNSNYMNSNMVAEIIFLSFTFICILAEYKLFNFNVSHMFLILSRIILCALSFVSIWNCKSRTTVISMLFFLFIYFFVPREKWTRKRLILLVVVIVLGGTLFPYLYLSLIKNSYVRNFVYEITGREMYTGREIIWTTLMRAFDGRKSAWIWGLGSNAGDAVATKWGTNVHSSYWGIIMNFGVCGIILFIVLIVGIIDVALKNKENNPNKVNTNFPKKHYFYGWKIINTILI